MSGFFALRRETFERAQRLLPLGYKVGLELMCKCRVRNVREVPIHFDARAHGESKLTLAQQFKYLEHLSRLYDFCYPRASPIAKFLITTVCGWFVGFAAFVTMVRLFPNRSGMAVPIGYLATIATTAVFHLRYVRTQREFLVTKHPWRDFLITALSEFIVATVVGLWLIRRVQVLYAWELFLIAWGCATVERYVLRKELMQDLRGLRRGLREEEIA
jgi:dolichol-phosphate mannosyltransferase